MKIVIPGGSGQLGELLARAFVAGGHEVVVLSRSPRAIGPWRAIPWDEVGTEIDGADAVINLAGRSVNCRYTDENRCEILDSRLRSTRTVGEAIRKARRPPAVWLQMSTATIYAHRYDAANDEKSGILGTVDDDVPETWRFSHRVALEWEQAAREIETPGTRKVYLRTAVVMSPDRGGPFDILMGLVRYGLGGTNGDGRQYISWIHDRDFTNAVNWLIEHPSIVGPVNLAAPNPLPNADFMAALRRAAKVPIGLPSAKWMLEIGAALMRSETELILKSRRVVPAMLLESGFQFEFPEWPSAAEDLCRRWRAKHGS
ncbi:MAG TPA: TIGR01777 family oxidoreductase [Bryobacteraceae bacterium]|jgi:hypothetical protein